LAMRMEERQTAFFQRVTMVAEQRLAQVLIQLADKFGTPEGPYLRVEQHLSHEELSQFVGTTRPRVSEFMKHFRELGVIGPSDQRVIRVHRPKALKFLSTERRRRRSSQHKAR